MRVRRTFPALMLASLLVWPGASRQEHAASPARENPELILVPVTVKNAAGEFLHDLRREEFRIFEDDVEQEIQFFSTDPLPLTAVVLIDNALPGKQAETVQASLGAIAGAFGPFDRVALATFETFFRQHSDFLSDNDQLYDRLRSLELSAASARHGGPLANPPRVNTAPASGPPADLRIGSGATTKNLDDALFEAAQLLQEPMRDRRKLILVITDGANSRNNTVSFDRVIRELLYHGITVYAVGFNPGILRRGSSVLERYTYRTGGEAYYAENRQEIEHRYGLITEQARYAYTLGYVPRNTDRSREFHSLEVRVRRPNLTVIARDGYFVSTSP